MRSRSNVLPVRGWLVLAVVLMLLPAVAPPAGPTAAVADTPIAFGTPVVISGTSIHDTVLAAGGEPGIKVDSAGTIYYTHVCCVLPAETFYSTDGGKTFQTMTSPAASRENTIGAEGDFAIDDADRVIFADTAIADIRVTRWSDHGATWDRTVDATHQNPINDRPWLGWGKGSLYLYTNGLTGQKVFQSYDEGLTWNPIEVGNFTQGIYTFTANRQDGGLWTVGPTLRSNVSADGGATWVTRTVASPARGKVSPPFGTSIATDEAGNGYAAWSTYDDTGCDIYVAASSDHGQTWGQPVQVNSTTGCSTFPWIDAGDPGHIVVAWYQTGVKKAANATSMPASATWQLHTAISTDFLSAPSFTEATLPNVTIDKGALNRDVWDFFQVAIGPDGRFHIAYSEDTSGGCPEPVTTIYGSCKHAWYVGQAGGPLLHANRIAPATSVLVENATVSDNSLAVSGAPVFKAAPSQTVFSGTSATTFIGGAIKPVGPDSGELLFTLSTPPNGTPGLDGLPGTRYTWGFTVDGAPHNLCLSSRQQNGPHFVLDGKELGGTIDGFDGKAIARVPMSAIGARPGSAIMPTGASEGAAANCVSGVSANQTPNNAAKYTVPGPAVTLSVQQDGVEVASAPGVLSADTTAFTGSLDVSALAPGSYELVTTACYAGDCASSATPITI